MTHRALMARRRTEGVLSALRASASPLTTQDVAREAGLEPRAAYAILYQLLQTEQVQRGGSGRRAKAGEKQVRWRLHPAQPVAAGPDGCGDADAVNPLREMAHRVV